MTGAPELGPGPPALTFEVGAAARRGAYVAQRKPVCYQRRGLAGGFDAGAVGRREFPSYFNVLGGSSGPRPRLGISPGPDVNSAGRNVAGEDAIVSGVAGRYARALFDLAKEAGVIEPVARDLQDLGRLIDESPDLRRLVKSPIFDRHAQAAVMTALLEKAGAHELTRKFVGLVAENRRLAALDAIIRAYAALVARHRGEVSAEVVSAHALTDAQLAKLTDTLKAATGSDVRISTRTDATLLGGLTVRLGSRMVDTSLRTKLNRLKLAMKEAG